MPPAAPRLHADSLPDSRSNSLDDSQPDSDPSRDPKKPNHEPNEPNRLEQAGISSALVLVIGRQDKRPLSVSFRSVSTPRRLNDIQVLAL